MVLSLPGARALFSQIQEALCHVKGKRVTLSTDVHEALEDFKGLAEDVANRPTHMYKLILIQMAPCSRQTVIDSTFPPRSQGIV